MDGAGRLDQPLTRSRFSAGDAVGAAPDARRRARGRPRRRARLKLPAWRHFWRQVWPSEWVSAWRWRMVRWITRLSRLPPGAGVAASFLLLLAAIGYGVVKGDHLPGAIDWAKNARDATASSLGFRITTISLSGEKEMSREDILNAIGVTNRTSLLFLDADAARARLLAIPRIGDAAVAQDVVASAKAAIALRIGNCEAQAAVGYCFIVEKCQSAVWLAGLKGYDHAFLVVGPPVGAKYNDSSTWTDAIICDLRMPGMGGVEAAQQIRSEFPNARMIALTTYGGDEDIRRALAAGVQAYLTKDVLHDELLKAIHAVHAGQTYLPAAVAASDPELRRLRPVQLETVRFVQTDRAGKYRYDSKLRPPL